MDPLTLTGATLVERRKASQSTVEMTTANQSKNNSGLYHRESLASQSGMSGSNSSNLNSNKKDCHDNDCKDGHHNHGYNSSHLEKTDKSVPLHNHNHHNHNHNHNHNHSHNHSGHCEGQRSKVPQVRVVYTPPSDDELKKATPQDMRTSLETLVRLGGFEDAFQPLVTLILEKRPDANETVLNALGEDHYSLLHWAAKRTDDVRFLQLLCTKVKPDMLNIPSSDSVAMRPLHWAATEGGLPHASTLLKYGANLEGTDGAGCTPLLIAAQYGHVDLVAFFLQRGANINAVDKNRDSALHWAAYKGSIQVCGHLLFRGELSWTTPDAYSQTPLHLAAIRGNTAVVRYLLQLGTDQEAKLILHMPDKNGKTPLDLAIIKQKPTVELVLRETMEKYDKWGKRTRSMIAQLCSYHSWQIWLGCSAAQDVDVSPKFPLYFMMTHMLCYTLWYPFVFTPVYNTSSGVLWDYSFFNAINILGIVFLWYCHYKVRTTDPGRLDDSTPETAMYRKLYEQTIESFSDDSASQANMGQLCHTCHILRPLRSKHCRDARRCVLLFDHHCPFVGNTVGMYNYKWFYLTLLSMTYCCITFSITLYIYLSRQFSWFLCLFGIYLATFVLFGGGMLVYHTQLSMMNLTTNEHINVSRYKYLRGEQGEYRNPFDMGWGRNFLSRFFPSSSNYALPTQHQPLLPHRDGADAV